MAALDQVFGMDSLILCSLVAFQIQETKGGWGAFSTMTFEKIPFLLFRSEVACLTDTLHSSLSR